MANPVESFPASATVLALNGTIDSRTGLPYLADGIRPTDSPSYREQYDRREERLNRIIDASNNLRFACVGSGLGFGVWSGFYKLGGAFKTFGGLASGTLTDDATNYVWIDSANTVQQDTAAFPTSAVDHYRIAIVTTSGGVITAVQDVRGYQVHVVPTATTSSDTGTDETVFTLDASNAGAGNDQAIVFNRGSTSAEDAAMNWDETNDLFSFVTEKTSGTLAPINVLGVYCSGSAMLDANGAAKVAAAVAGSGLGHSGGVLSVNTSSAAGTSLSGDNVAVDPSDGITLDANGVAVSLTANGGLQFTGSAGSGTLGVYADNATLETSSGGVRVKDGGLSPIKSANYAAASGGALAFIVKAQLVAGNTVTIFNADAPCKFRVVDAWSIAESADGGTWKLDNGTNDLTNAVTVTGTDKTRNALTTLDDAYHEIASAGTLRAVGDGAAADCTVYVLCMRVA